MKRCCDMKGFLSFQLLRLIAKKPMSGEELRCELEKRKGHKPSCGTIYPVLKMLHEAGWIAEISKGKEKKYQITKQGQQEVKIATKKFVELFCDLKEDFLRRG